MISDKIHIYNKKNQKIFNKIKRLQVREKSII